MASMSLTSVLTKSHNAGAMVVRNPWSSRVFVPVALRPFQVNITIDSPPPSRKMLRPVIPIWLNKLAFFLSLFKFYLHFFFAYFFLSKKNSIWLNNRQTQKID